MINSLMSKYESDIQVAFSQIEDPSNGIHQFIKNIASEYPFLDLIAIKSKMFDAVANSPRPGSENESIQKLVHRVWLTNEDHPKLPEEKFFAVMKEGVGRFPLGWKTIFWTNSKVVAEFASSYVNDEAFEVRNPFDSHWKLSLSKNIRSLLDDRKYAFACDQLRIELIYKFGGVYCDMGIRFMDEIAPLLNGPRYAFLLGNSLFFQNSFFAAPKDDPLYRMMVDIQLNPYNVPKKLVGELDSTTEGWLASGLMITLLYLLMTPKSVDVRVFRGNGALIHWGSQRSWYQTSKTMNGLSDSAIVENASLSLIDPNKWECEQRSTFC